MLTKWVDKVNGYGVLFRFILPFLLALVGTLIMGRLNDIQASQKELTNLFTNHLAHHQSLEKELENRLTCIETLVRKLK